MRTDPRRAVAALGLVPVGAGLFAWSVSWAAGADVGGASATDVAVAPAGSGADAELALRVAELESWVAAVDARIAQAAGDAAAGAVAPAPAPAPVADPAPAPVSEPAPAPVADPAPAPVPDPAPAPRAVPPVDTTTRASG